MRLLFVTFIIVVIALDSWNRWQNLCWIGQHREHKTPVPLFRLNIAILSARENFDKRHTIRQTWLRSVQLINEQAHQWGVTFEVKAHFVLGNHSCPLHPLMRDDFYGCSPRKTFALGQLVQHDDNATASHALLTLRSKAVTSCAVQYFKGFSFRNFYSVIVTRIAVWSTLIGSVDKLSIVLWQADNERALFSATLNASACNLTEPVCWLDAEIDLEPDLVYIVSIEQDIDLHNYVPMQWQLKSASSEITRILRSYYGHFESKPFDIETHGFAINLYYRLKEPEQVRKYLENTDKYSQQWQHKLDLLDRKVAQEWNTYIDIVLLDMIDYYRNLPLKWLLYLRKYRGENQISMTHILKTDDDCYLNIFSIIELLTRYYKKKTTWFGNFRQNWPVNHYGKWADDAFNSGLYPEFSCGSGYIITRDIVDWINLNSDHLYRFQGEDVSMGIWLAAIQPTKVEDRRWICGYERSLTNTKQFLSVPQMSREEMLHMHKLCHADSQVLANKHFSN